MKRSLIDGLVVVVLAVRAAAQDVPPVAETVVVTATRSETRLADTPSSVVVLDRQTLLTTAAPTIDDALRQVPGFTLFRRSGSRVANPTAQGVSLRGIGGSGASRALVLDDGIPLNDPFGGWVYWGRVQRLALERVEVLRGGASDLYGSAAMAGVIQFVPAREGGVRVDLSTGTGETLGAALFAAAPAGNLLTSISADWLTTAGYVLVVPESRGAVDVAASSRHTALDAAIRHERGFVRASWYRERRGNGTPMQINDTTTRQVALGANLDRGPWSVLSRGWIGTQDYAQTFSAIAADRSTERLTVDQGVPSSHGGLTAHVSRVVAASHAILAGLEFREVEGESRERQFAVNGAVSSLIAGGRQRVGALFVEDVFAATPAVTITGGVRLDSWSNFEAHRNGVPLSSRDQRSISPRLTALWRIADSLSLTASAYEAFRAPTLNELYRGFRVGNVVTNANENLGAEQTRAFELGVRLRHLRATAFLARVTDTIANVTISAIPTLITRQRQNLGATRAVGLEVEAERRWQRGLSASAGYLIVDSEVTEGALAGRRVPQVPRHQLTLQGAINRGGATVSVQTRWSSRQFDDDLNALVLESAAVVDAFASIPIAKALALTLSAENLLDEKIEASATPVVTMGQPRSLRIGLRYVPSF